MGRGSTSRLFFYAAAEVVGKIRKVLVKLLQKLVGCGAKPCHKIIELILLVRG